MRKSHAAERNHSGCRRIHFLAESVRPSHNEDEPFPTGIYVLADEISKFNGSMLFALFIKEDTRIAGAKGAKDKLALLVAAEAWREAFRFANVGDYDLLEREIVDYALGIAVDKPVVQRIVGFADHDEY